VEEEEENFQNLKEEEKQLRSQCDGLLSRMPVQILNTYKKRQNKIVAQLLTLLLFITPVPPGS
jgi:predicted  nucleic acid-binding Zn-ribbon protein